MLYINGRFLSQEITGLQRYAIEVVRAIDKLAKDIKIKLVIPPKTKHDLSLANIETVRTRTGRGHFWEQFVLPLYVKNDILINLTLSAPLRTKNIIVVHDLAEFREPKWYTKKFLAYYRILRPLLINKAARVITVSNFSKQEIIDLFKTEESKINVIYEGKEHILNAQTDSSILKKLNIDNHSFILSVGSLNPRKNFRKLIDAYLSLKLNGYKLVIVGGENKKAFANSGNFERNNSVIFTGSIPDEQLKALYLNAAMFVCPSLYEGYGLPVLEAMACKCPVVASDIPSFREIFQSSAFYVDPNSQESISTGISRVLSEKELRDRLIKEGLERAGLCSWDNTARDFINVLKKYN